MEIAGDRDNLWLISGQIQQATNQLSFFFFFFGGGGGGGGAFFFFRKRVQHFTYIIS